MNKTQQTIHYSELPPARPGEQTFQEWETYRSEVGRLLAEGNEGRFVLIKGDRIAGLFDTYERARNTGADQFLLGPYLVQQVRAREPLYYHIPYLRIPFSHISLSDCCGSH